MATILVRLVSARFEVFERERPVVGDIDPFQHGALALAVEMPGHDIGMMLHDGEHDFIALPDMGEAETGGDEIDRLGRRAREDDLLMRAGVEKAAHAFARRLIGFGRRIGEIMQAAMNIGVFVFIGMGQPLDHRARLLRRGGIVEIDQRLAVGTLGEDGKVGAQGLDVERRIPLVSDPFVHAVSLRRISAIKFALHDSFLAIGLPGATIRQNGVTFSGGAPAFMSSIAASATILTNMLEVIGQTTSAPLSAANCCFISRTSRVSPRGIAAT